MLAMPESQVQKRGTERAVASSDRRATKWLDVFTRFGYAQARRSAARIVGAEHRIAEPSIPRQSA